jgi:hypothetical protein
VAEAASAAPATGATCWGAPSTWLTPYPRLPDRTRMPTSARKPSPYERAGSAEINAMVARVAPAILELLGDGVPRSKPAIVAALAGRHDRRDVMHALIRLAVTGQVEETGGRYTLAPEPTPDMG